MPMGRVCGHSGITLFDERIGDEALVQMSDGSRLGSHKSP